MNSVSAPSRCTPSVWLNWQALGRAAQACSTSAAVLVRRHRNRRPRLPFGILGIQLGHRSRNLVAGNARKRDQRVASAIGIQIASAQADLPHLQQDLVLAHDTRLGHRLRVAPVPVLPKPQPSFHLPTLGHCSDESMIDDCRFMRVRCRELYPCHVGVLISRRKFPWRKPFCNSIPAITYWSRSLLSPPERWCTMATRPHADSCPVTQEIPAKHKMALVDLKPGDLIRMYGMVVGEVVAAHSARRAAFDAQRAPSRRSIFCRRAIRSRLRCPMLRPGHRAPSWAITAPMARWARAITGWCCRLFFARTATWNA